MSRGNEADLVFTTFWLEDVNGRRDDLGRGQRIMRSLSRLAHGDRTLAVLTDDLSEVRVLHESAQLARVKQRVAIIFANEAKPSIADVVALVARPGKKGLGSSVELCPPVDPDVAVGAVRSGGMFVQVRDDIGLSGYEVAARALIRSIQRRRRSCGR